MDSAVATELLTLLASFIVVILIGFALRRGGIIPRDAAQTLNGIIINAALPALVITTVMKADLRPELAILPFVAAAVMAVTGGLAWLAGRALRLPHRLQGSFILAVIQGNTAYLGYPVILTAFGTAGLVEGIFYDYGVGIVILTVGVAIARHYGDAENQRSLARELLTFPPLLALPVGLLLRMVGLPGFLTDALTLLGSATVPLVMLSLGLTLRGHGFRKYAGLIGAAGIAKLFVAPVVALGILLAIGLEGRIVTVSAVQSAMPVGMMTVLFALRYRLDEDYLSSAVMVTTVASVITLPLLIAIID